MFPETNMTEVIEVALVFDSMGDPIHWHVPLEATSGAIPDSRELWDVLWENRKRLGGVAHTHPWVGSALPSDTDITTFSSIESGIGRHLVWPVVTLSEVNYFINKLSLFKSVEVVFPTLSDSSIEELRRLSTKEMTWKN